MVSLGLDIFSSGNRTTNKRIMTFVSHHDIGLNQSFDVFAELYMVLPHKLSNNDDLDACKLSPNVRGKLVALKSSQANCPARVFTQACAVYGCVGVVLFDDENPTSVGWQALKSTMPGLHHEDTSRVPLVRIEGHGENFELLFQHHEQSRDGDGDEAMLLSEPWFARITSKHRNNSTKQIILSVPYWCFIVCGMLLSIACMLMSLWKILELASSPSSPGNSTRNWFAPINVVLVCEVTGNTLMTLWYMPFILANYSWFPSALFKLSINAPLSLSVVSTSAEALLLAKAYTASLGPIAKDKVKKGKWMAYILAFVSFLLVLDGIIETYSTKLVNDSISGGMYIICQLSSAIAFIRYGSLVIAHLKRMQRSTSLPGGERRDSNKRRNSTIVTPEYLKKVQLERAFANRIKLIGMLMLFSIVIMMSFFVLKGQSELMFLILLNLIQVVNGVVGFVRILAVRTQPSPLTRRVSRAIQTPLQQLSQCVFTMLSCPVMVWHSFTSRASVNMSSNVLGSIDLIEGDEHEIMSHYERSMASDVELAGARPMDGTNLRSVDDFTTTQTKHETRCDAQRKSNAAGEFDVCAVVIESQCNEVNDVIAGHVVDEVDTAAMTSSMLDILVVDTNGGHTLWEMAQVNAVKLSSSSDHAENLTPPEDNTLEFSESCDVDSIALSWTEPHSLSSHCEQRQMVKDADFVDEMQSGNNNGFIDVIIEEEEDDDREGSVCESESSTEAGAGRDDDSNCGNEEAGDESLNAEFTEAKLRAKRFQELKEFWLAQSHAEL